MAQVPGENLSSMLASQRWLQVGHGKKRTSLTNRDKKCLAQCARLELEQCLLLALRMQELPLMLCQRLELPLRLAILLQLGLRLGFLLRLRLGLELRLGLMLRSGLGRTPQGCQRSPHLG